MSESHAQDPSTTEAGPSPFETFEVPATSIVAGPFEPLTPETFVPESFALEQIESEPAETHVPGGRDDSGPDTLSVESILCQPVIIDPQPAMIEPVQTTSPAVTPTQVEAAQVEVAQVEVAPVVDEEVKPSEPPRDASFLDLPLRDEVQQAILKSGYEKPTAIQAEIIPYMLDGRDVLAQSQTGTGKTAAFALPILSRIEVGKQKPQVLVLAPTRELAIQVAKSFSTYGSCLPRFSVAAIYGGQDYTAQFKQLRRGVEVIVGTPGRVIDHIKRGTLDLSELDCLVLDEADEMLNMGFLDDVQFVLDQTPEKRQIALFSATLPLPIRNISKRYLKNPARITIKEKTMTAELTRQRALIVSPRDKIDTLKRLLEVEVTDGVIVFANTKDMTVTIAEQLNREGLKAVALNGDMPQKVRERTIEQLKGGHLNILVATDVAARGLDVTRVSHVFNYDVPQDTESYIHRIGRTGRAGRKGEAFIFLTGGQKAKLRFIERATKQPIEIVQPPTANEINAIRTKTFTQSIAEMAANQDLTMFQEMIEKFAEESGTPLLTIAAALAQIGQQGRPFFMADRPKRKFEPNSRFESSGKGYGNGDGGYSKKPKIGSKPPSGGKGKAGLDLGPPETGKDRYRIQVGWKDGVKPGNIVGAIANEGGLSGEHIGPIKIHDAFSTVDLPAGMPREVFQTLSHTRVAGKLLDLSLEGKETAAPRPGSGRDFQSSKPHRSNDRGGKGPAKGNAFHAEKRKKRKTKARPKT